MRDVVNTTAGFNVALATAEDRKWYRWARFPLLPIVSYRPAEGWNTSSWIFSWLMIRLWTLDSFQFSVGIDLDDQGLKVLGILPYLRWVIWLAIFPERWHQRLWRTSPDMKRGGWS